MARKEARWFLRHVLAGQQPCSSGRFGSPTGSAASPGRGPALCLLLS